MKELGIRISVLKSLVLRVYMVWLWSSQDDFIGSWL